ncbi:FtsX-like permease family protein [Gracilibacillus sp. D59]|uniref:ABC transporter permease n=1 Tax=Gracilibacillus sp. D59 TaxID=3457434 RepID=UPI003FCCF844
MTLMKVIFRKMLNNRWLTGSLFLGLIITVSLVSSIPTYSSSIMQKLLIKELEDYQKQQNEYPGAYVFSDTFSKTNVKNPDDALEKVEEINANLIKSTGLPIEAEVNVIGTNPLKLQYEDESRRETSLQPGKLMMVSKLEEHITIKDGRLPNTEAVDGVIEVLVSEDALQKREMVLNTGFIIGEKNHQFTINPVGTFQPKNLQDPYWQLIRSNFSEDFIMLKEQFKQKIVKNHEGLLGIGRFSAAFDYHEINEDKIPQLLNLNQKLQSEISAVKNSSLLFEFPVENILQGYVKKSEQLTIMLWSLNAPVLVMLAIYLFMVSRLIIGRQLNEIAIFSSRGASPTKIIVIYFVEILILGSIAFLLGPYIGVLIVKLLGASNGFLEFVQRSALPIQIGPKSFGYALVAILLSIVMIMIPVYQASKQSIVIHKLNQTKTAGTTKWYMIFIDLSLLTISIYGLLNFHQRQIPTSNNGDMYVDPIMFFIPAIFIIGLGLFILRIYPFLLKAIYKLGERFWPVSIYTSFIQVSRSSKQYQFLMLFLIMTIGIGVFSASAARTINNNIEEQILYENGVDVQVSVQWDSTRPAPVPFYSSPSVQASEEPEQTEKEPSTEVVETIYSEPPFDPFTKLKGVKQATKVFTKEQVILSGNGNTSQNASLMAIEPKKFGETAWFKESLLPYHWYNYLNLLAIEPSSVLVSQSVANSLGVKPGDYVTMNWPNSDKSEFVIYGIIEYWPTFNPLEEKDYIDGKPGLVVANLPYVQNNLGLEPYDVWMKLKQDTRRESFYNNINELAIPVTKMDDVYPKLIEHKNSSIILGINGTMSLGFIIAIMVSFIGFLLYWILTIKSRTLQYGIYRAMGIPISKLISILVWEQIMTSGLACLLGIMLGGLTSRLFVPLFKLSLDPEQLVPPFSVIFDSSDKIKIYLFVSFMLLIGIIVLIIFLRKIKIHQAIKLGED